MKKTIFVCTSIALFFCCSQVCVGNESLINLDEIDDVSTGSLSTYFSFMHDKQTVLPEQISLDYSKSDLVSLTVQYGKMDYFQSLKQWLDDQLPGSLVAYSETQGYEGGLWRSVENSVAVQLIRSTENSKLLLLIIGFKAQEK